jgi:transcriptional regulator
MYVPAVFRQDDRGVLFEHVRSYPFATLITQGKTGLGVSHVPLLLHEGGEGERARLRGHLARENPQVADLELGGDALAIFHGPHAYVSPSVYLDEKPAVPTWNYAVVHARGPARVVGKSELRGILDDTVARFDSSSWRLDESPQFLEKMLAAVAGFEIAVDALEGKWKVSQNRPMEDRRAVADWLEGGDQSSRSLAKIMRACF